MSTSDTEFVGEGGATDIASPLPMEIDRYLLAADHGQASATTRSSIECSSD